MRLSPTTASGTDNRTVPNSVRRVSVGFIPAAYLSVGYMSVGHLSVGSVSGGHVSVGVLSVGTFSVAILSFISDFVGASFTPGPSISVDVIRIVPPPEFAVGAAAIATVVA